MYGNAQVDRRKPCRAHRTARRIGFTRRVLVLLFASRTANKASPEPMLLNQSSPGVANV